MFGNLRNPQNLIWLALIAILSLQSGGGPIPGMIRAAARENVPVFFAILVSACIVLLICFPLHELGHALAADKLGDHTPRSYGRISLNPFVHLDPWGTIMFLLFGFGWATTPVNPRNFRGNPNSSRALVAVAGPVMNLLVAIIAALIFRAVTGNVPLARVFGMGSLSAITEFGLNTLLQLVSINLLLFFFNLVPVPPLDGWSIVRGVVPPNIVEFVERYSNFIWLLLFATPVVSMLISPMIDPVQRLLLGY
jgi:Zn-dependent protease